MRQWRDGDGAIGEEDIVFFLSQVVRGKIGGRKPATVAERIRAIRRKRAALAEEPDPAQIAMEIL